MSSRAPRRPSGFVPRILVSPQVTAQAGEMRDLSITLSTRYQTALMEHGALPLILPATVSPDLIAQAVAASDGVVLTGGDDVQPSLYRAKLAARLRGQASVTPDGGARDYREILLVAEAFRQGRPLLAICRGLQLLNVALGGTLHTDIAAEIPGAREHRRMDKKAEIVHEARLTPGSLVAKITRRQRLGVNSTHHQAVARPAPPLRATGQADDGVVECLELKPSAAMSLPFLLGVQFHPERLADRYSEHRAIFGAFVEACREA